MRLNICPGISMFFSDCNVMLYKINVPLNFLLTKQQLDSWDMQTIGTLKIPMYF
jgi:hypothetical protein